MNMLGARRARRRLVNRVALAACLLLAIVAVYPLLDIISSVVKHGAPVVTWNFLSTSPDVRFDLVQGVVRTGGVYHAILGTGMVVGLSLLIGAPIGILAGIWLSEYGRGRSAAIVRAAADAMSGIPSIVAGLFGYVLVVQWLGVGYSALAAGVALSLLLVPTVTRTTEEGLRTVPQSLRDASLALGAPKWRTTLQVVLPNAWGSVATGLLLATARVSGETAPILLTAQTSQFLPKGITDVVGTLPQVIFDYGRAADHDLNRQAQGAALVLMTMVLGVNLLVRLLARPRERPGPVAWPRVWLVVVANLVLPGLGTLAAKRISGVVQMAMLGLGIYTYAAGTHAIAAWFLGVAWCWAAFSSVLLLRGSHHNRASRAGPGSPAVP
jgi:phosphate transport system permease protein